MFELKIKTHFAGAHQLAMVGEKCENLHGHNWHIEVYILGEKLNSAGVLVDFADIKKAVRQVVNKEFDHKFLNELEIFKDYQPTSERIAEYIAKRTQELLNKNINEKVKVSKVSVYESFDSCASFFPNI